MRIVLTHGRAQAYQIAGSLERLWEDALRDGLRAVGQPDAASVPIDFAFYGDIWRPDRRALAEARDADGDDGERGGDTAADPSDGERLVTTEPSLQKKPTDLEIELAGELLPPDPDRERLDWNRLAGLISDLDGVLGVGKPLLAWFLKDLDEYFRDDEIRQRVLTTMRSALQATPEPKLLLGHSMGSIVAYDLLATDGAAALGVRDLITFGSPLGMASLHARVAALHPGTPYPEGLDSWVNVYNEQDFATVVRKLDPLFRGDGPGIIDVSAVGQAPTLFDPGRGHDPIIYLSSVGLAQWVADSLARFASGAPVGDGRGAGGGDEEVPPEPPRPRSIGDAVRRGRGWTRSEPPSDTGGPGGAAPDDGERGGGGGGAPEPSVARNGGHAGNGGGPAMAAPTMAPPEMAPPEMAAPPAPAAAAPPKPAPGMRTVERTASADFPPIVKPGSKHELKVAIAGKAVHATEGRVALEVPQDQEWLDLRVGVYAPDFKIEATSDKSRSWEDLRVNLDKPKEVAEATFKLTASRVKNRRESVIYVTIYRGNLPVGQLSLFTAIDPAGEVRAASITLGETAAKDPDYVLVVTDRSPGVKGAGPFDISVSKEGEWLNQPLGSFPVTIDAWDYARQRLEGFRLVKAEKTPEDRVRAAEALGLDLWWDLPDAFRAFYWSELHGKDVSIAIYSQEPYIPWELIRPQRERAGEEANFLGVSFRIARWRQALKFPDPLDVTGFAVIAPVYGPGSGSQPLPGAQTEADELEQHFGATRLPGDRSSVRKFLESGDGIQLVHFAGHGEFDPDAKDDTLIKLADEPLLPQDIHRAKVGRTSRPFAVLNACEVGEEGWALTRIGGWAQAFCDVGFSGFVGPYWAVNDRIARKVANRFYGSLGDGMTVGEALREVRSGFYNDPEDRGHPSWLAYTLHCQPNVHIHMPKVAAATGGGGER
jgi:CHAT domain